MSHCDENTGLKVYGGCFDGNSRKVVAASSKAEAARILGCSAYVFRNYAAETANEDEVKRAMAQPRTVVDGYRR